MEFDTVLVTVNTETPVVTSFEARVSHCSVNLPELPDGVHDVTVEARLEGQTVFRNAFKARGGRLSVTLGNPG